MATTVELASRSLNSTVLLFNLILQLVYLVTLNYRFKVIQHLLTHSIEAWPLALLNLDIELMTSRMVTPKPYTSFFFDSVPSMIYSGGMYPMHGKIE